jgi:hypothetical protein
MVYGVVVGHQRFRGPLNTMVSYHNTTQRCNPDLYLNLHRRENLTSIERIVLLDFIHRPVSQKTNKIEELKI